MAQGDDRTTLIDAAPALASLLHGKTKIVDAVPAWNDCSRPWLSSAVTGGQWPQARRARVPLWDVDGHCQLCKMATGTLEHRWVCPVTCPAEGWIQHSKPHSEALATLGEGRLRVLRTRGIAAIPARIGPVVQAPKIRWFDREPDPTDCDLDWYVDGSLMHPKVAELTTAAAAIVVVSRTGCLVACAEVALPSNVKSAPAAEAAVVQLAIAFPVACPRITTDCQSVLTTARGGTALATGANRPLAGTWGAIAAAVGCDVSELLERGLLRWMPAHLGALSAVGARMSDGRPSVAPEACSLTPSVFVAS